MSNIAPHGNGITIVMAHWFLCIAFTSSVYHGPHGVSDRLNISNDYLFIVFDYILYHL